LQSVCIFNTSIINKASSKSFLLPLISLPLQYSSDKVIHRPLKVTYGNLSNKNLQGVQKKRTSKNLLTPVYDYFARHSILIFFAYW